MQLSEMHFTEDASRKLSHMKGRTGLTPNLLARIGFCLSLNEPDPPIPADYEGTGHINIKRHVLTGQYDPLFIALLKESCHLHGLSLDEEGLAALFKAHMNRGVLLLNKQFKSLDRLLYFLPKEARFIEEPTFV